MEFPSSSEDHVHLLVKVRPDRAVSDLLRGVKARSSGWVHRFRPELAAFAWQAGYGAFSVSQSLAEKVRAYLANQEEHHRRVSFAEELQLFFEANGLVVPADFLD